MDGKPPYFERYSINSASVLFKEWEEFPDPNLLKEYKKQLRFEKDEAAEFRIATKTLHEKGVRDDTLGNKDKFN